MAAAVTVAEAGRRFIAAKAAAKGGPKPAQIEYLQGLVAKRLGALADMPVAKASAGDIAVQLLALQAEAPSVAKAVQILISGIFDFAAAADMIPASPAIWRKGSKLYVLCGGGLGKAPIHHPAAPHADAPAIYARLAARPHASAAALRFVILTACRKQEALGLRWREIDMAAGLWHLPADRSKSGRPISIPLSAPAQAILAKMAAPNGAPDPDAFCFPGANGRKGLSSGALAACMGTIGCAEFTVHGWRSTFRSWVDEATDMDGDVAERCLNHQTGSAVERSYRRGDALMKRAAMMARWADFLMKADTSPASAAA